MHIQPLQDYYLIDIEEPKERASDAGLLLAPDAAKEQPMKGRVIAVGPGRTTDEGSFIDINPSIVGKLVLFTRYSPERYKDGDKEMYLVKSENVIAILEDTLT